MFILKIHNQVEKTQALPSYPVIYVPCLQLQLALKHRNEQKTNEHKNHLRTAT